MQAGINVEMVTSNTENFINLLWRNRC